MLEQVPQPIRPELRPEVVLIVDDNPRFLSLCLRWLNAEGFRSLFTATGFEAAMEAVEEAEPDLVLLDIHLGDNYDGLQILQRIRDTGYQGTAIVISADSSKKQCFRAAKAGANDFLLKRPDVNIGNEIVRILAGKESSRPALSPLPLSDLGYLRSFGLTPREVEILESFAHDFPAQKIVADRVNTEPVQLRKAFGRIYKKLDVDNMTQLVHLLTVCSMFEHR